MRNFRLAANGQEWDVLSKSGNVVGHFAREADARSWADQKEQNVACDRLKGSLSTIQRRYVIELRPRVAAKAGFSLTRADAYWVRLADFYSNLRRFADTSAWEEECTGVADRIRQFGGAVGSIPAPQDGDLEEVLHLAGLLRDEWRGWSRIATVDETTEVTPWLTSAVISLAGSRIAGWEVRKEFEQTIEVEPRSGMDRQELAAFVCHRLRCVDWIDAADAFLKDMGRVLDDLRAALPWRIKPLKADHNPAVNGMPPWVPYCGYILLLPDQPPGNKEDGGHWFFWGKQWLGDAPSGDWKGRSRPFDVSLAMDSEYRVRRPGSGQVRKKGSRRDSTGHR